MNTSSPLVDLKRGTKITNTTQIVEFIQQIPTLQNQLNNINEEMNNYLKFMKNNNFEKKENESKEDALRRAESILDRLIEIEERRNELKENSHQASEMIETMKKKIDDIKNECDKDDDNFCDANIETIDEIIEIRRLIIGGALKINGEKSQDLTLDMKEDFVIQLGKGTMFKVLGVGSK